MVTDNTEALRVNPERSRQSWNGFPLDDGVAQTTWPAQ